MVFKKTLALALGIAPLAMAGVIPRSDASPHFDAVSKYMDSIQEELWPINKEIFDNPELGGEEFKAHKLLTDFIGSKEGWVVDKAPGNITTAFAAVFEGSGDGPIVSFNAEYDALPDIGHACGHNLIAISSLGGALATAEIMRTQKLPGKVVLFGTPAEETNGGKVQMLEAGVFQDYDIDLSLMAHPAPADTPYAITYSIDSYNIEYHGKAAHASASPWEGVNAQDAINIAYNAIGLLRQQSLPTDQVHGIITSGGSAANVIPSLATGLWTVRAKDEDDLAVWTERIMKTFEAGALATGATLNVTTAGVGYANMVTNEVLATSYAKWFTGLGGKLAPPELDKLRGPAGSTDQGDVSHAFPAIHPFFAITNEDGSLPETGNHTPAFTTAAGSKAAFKLALRTAKSLAGAAVDALSVEGLMDKIKEDFKAQQNAKKLKRRSQRMLGL